MRSYWLPIVAVLCLMLGAFIAGLQAAQHGLIFNDVTLEDGATDGDSGYFKIGKDLIIIAAPDSYEHSLLVPLKGKKVYFELRLQ